MSTEYRVYGPPGCGKTTYIAAQATQMADQYGEDQVSICSLTNTAVREAVGRELSLPDENITTLHARCKRSLQAPPPAEAFIEDFIAAYPRFAGEGCLPPGLRRVRRKLDEPETTDEVMISGSREPTYYERVQILRQQMIPESQWQPTLRSWYGAWSDFMAQTGRLDFTGWLEAAREEQCLPAQQVVYVDEAQDHTPLQLSVIRSWQTRHRVLVGDDDQNLYEWSGAIPAEFFAYPIPDGHEKVLEQSYRVPRAVHAAAERWVRRLRSRRDKVYLPRGEDGALYHNTYSLQQAEGGLLPPHLRNSEPGTVMILASAGYLLDPVIQLLRAEGIPFHNPYRRSNSTWNPLGTTGRALAAYLQPAWTGNEAYRWLNVLRSTGVFRSGQRKAALEWVQRMGRHEVLLEDLHNFLLPTTISRVEHEDLSLFEERRKGVPGDWSYALDIYRRLSAEERVPRVIVGTIHSVKGGQADHVYLMPDLSPAAYEDLWGPNADRIIRLMYVGMTRARVSLTLGGEATRRAVSW